jgi:hypothetical protein
MLVNARATATSGASTSPGSTAGTATIRGTAGNTSACGAAAKDGPAATTSGNATYVLEGRASELCEQIGHQVEIRGRFSTSSASSDANAPRAKDPAGATAPGAQDAGQVGTAIFRSSISR